MKTLLQDLRQAAGEAATRFVRSGMVLGIGSGSTTNCFIDSLGGKYRQGAIRDILAVPASVASEERLRSFGIPITHLADHPALDLAVDGADEVDPDLNLIKGLGKALLREKVVEIHARKLVIVVDESKLVSRLGEKGPLPVEILQFESPGHIRWLNTLNCEAELWLEEDGSPVVTDNGNYLARLWFEGGIPDAYELDDRLSRRPGILEHGLFLDMATDVIVAGQDGVQHLERELG